MVTIIHKQRGAALFAGLAMAGLLTALAVTLLSNSVMDQKISAANSENMQSVDATVGGVSNVFYQAVNKKINGTNFFSDIGTAISERSVEDGSSIKFSTRVDIDSELQNQSEATNDCAREKSGSSNTTLVCRNYILTVTNSYGKNDAATTAIQVGVSYKQNNGNN